MLKMIIATIITVAVPSFAIGFFVEGYSWRRMTKKSGRIYANQKDSNNILFYSRSDADKVLDNTLYLLTNYGVVTLADFKELAGVTPNFLDHKWGWTDLKGVMIKRDITAYFVSLPKTKFLD